MWILDPCLWRREDRNAALFDAAMREDDLVLAMSRRLGLPLACCQRGPGFGRIALDREQVVGLVCLDHDPTAMLDQGRDFMMILAVAIGAADAFAVDGNGLCDVQTWLPMALKHRLPLLRAEGLHDPMQDRFGDRLMATGDRVLSAADGRKVRLTEAGRKLGRGHWARMTHQTGQQTHRQYGGHAVLTPLTTPDIVNLRHGRVNRLQRPDALLRDPGTTGKMAKSCQIT